MNSQEELVRQDYIVIEGNVTESYPGFIRLQSDTQQFGFRMEGPVQFQPGARVCVIALRDSDQAVFVINRVSGERHRVDKWRGSTGTGPRALSSTMSVLTFILLLIPGIGQMTAFAGGIGALIGGAATSGMVKGHPRVAFGRIVLALCIYFLGSVLWLMGVANGATGLAWLGFLVLVAGAAFYSFGAKRPGLQYLQALERFVDEVAAPAS